MEPSQATGAWVNFEHKRFRAEKNLLKYVRDHYTGEVIREGTIENYLKRRSVSESIESYKERLAISDYTPHFSVIVDSLAGMLFSAEKDAARTWNNSEGVGLGEPDDGKTIIGGLWKNVDGKGLGYTTLWKRLAIELVHSLRCFVVVDSPKGNARIRILPAHCVSNWREGENGIVEALVRDEVDTRDSIEQAPKDEVQFIRYTLEGTQRFKLNEKGDGVVAVDTLQPYEFYDRAGERTLPIFMVELPLERHVGFTLAKKCNAIFNMESARDFILWAACFPYLMIAGDDDFFEQTVKNIVAGAKALQSQPQLHGEHKWLSPDSAAATTSTTVLERKVEEFYIVSFREYGDAARERTATEVNQDVSSGVGAFLQLLKAAVDDAENAALSRVEQVHYSGKKEKWFIARVERSDNFLPMDVQGWLDRMKARYFADAPMPITRDGLKQVVRMAAENDGIQIDDAQLEAAVNAHLVVTAFRAVGQQMMPAEAKAEAVVSVLEAAGMIDPDAEGIMPLNREVIKKAALKLAIDAEAAMNALNAPLNPVKGNKDEEDEE
jgi:hypothetical protein